MKDFYRHLLLTAAVVAMAAVPSFAQDNEVADAHTGATQHADGHTGATQRSNHDFLKEMASRLTIGGYGEAVMTRNFYSDHFNRYKYPEQHSDDDSHGQFDLPHVVINLGYDFGRGWTVGMEIEFEHGGTESAVEVDADESGEYEAETEKGGEVALEQFWIEKSWSSALNLRIGEIIVPVGATNSHHMPTEFFTSYRPEGEASIFPCTWHQTGISLWGKAGVWRYEGQFLSGLDSERFGSDCFIHYGATSCYEYKIANVYAAAARVDNHSVPGLRMSLSGYIGNSFKNKLRSAGAKYDDVKGTVKIGSFDFLYDAHNIIARGNVDVATLSDAQLITTYNNSYPKHSGQDGSPSKHQPIGDKALAWGVEAGYNLMGLADRADANQKFVLFGRYEYYNPMQEGTHKEGYKWTEKRRWALGLNYMPMKEIVVKAEFSKRNLNSAYNDEPSVSMSIAFAY